MATDSKASTKIRSSDNHACTECSAAHMKKDEVCMHTRSSAVSFMLVLSLSFVFIWTNAYLNKVSYCWSMKCVRSASLGFCKYVYLQEEDKAVSSTSTGWIVTCQNTEER